MKKACIERVTSALFDVFMPELAPDFSILFKFQLVSKHSLKSLKTKTVDRCY